MPSILILLSFNCMGKISIIFCNAGIPSFLSFLLDKCSLHLIISHIQSILSILILFSLSSNFQAVVTNHLVVRGTYRSLSLVIYGNTAEDLGQFNIDVDMDSSLANLIYSSSEGKIEDLPAPLRSRKLSLEDSISSLNTLSLPLPMPDLSNEMKEFLLLVFKIWQIPDLADALCKVLCTVISLVSSFLVSGFGVSTERRKTLQCASDVFSDARDELHKLCEGHLSSLESEKHKPTGNVGNEWLFYSFGQCFPYEKITDRGSSLISQVSAPFHGCL